MSSQSVLLVKDKTLWGFLVMTKQVPWTESVLVKRARACIANLTPNLKRGSPSPSPSEGPSEGMPSAEKREDSSELREREGDWVKQTEEKRPEIFFNARVMFGDSLFEAMQQIDLEALSRHCLERDVTNFNPCEELVIDGTPLRTHLTQQEKTMKNPFPYSLTDPILIDFEPSTMVRFTPKTRRLEYCSTDTVLCPKEEYAIVALLMLEFQESLFSTMPQLEALIGFFYSDVTLVSLEQDQRQRQD